MGLVSLLNRDCTAGCSVTFMKLSGRWIVFLAWILLVASATGQQKNHHKTVEDRLAGLTVGVSSLSDAQRLFGSGIRVNLSDGTADVSFKGCHLSMEVDLRSLSVYRPQSN
jgi:Na+/H+-translocating membrane pyrophosphatase